MSNKDLNAQLKVTADTKSALAAVKELRAAMKEMVDLTRLNSKVTSEEDKKRLAAAKEAKEIAKVKAQNDKGLAEQARKDAQAASEQMKRAQEDSRRLNNLILQQQDKLDRARDKAAQKEAQKAARDEERAAKAQAREEVALQRQTASRLKAEELIRKEAERTQAAEVRRKAQVDYYHASRSSWSNRSTWSGLMSRGQDNFTPSQWAAMEKRMKDSGMLRTFARAGQDAGRAFTGSFAGYIGGGLTAAFTAAGLTNLTQRVFTQSAELETLRLQLQGVYGDAERAQRQYNFLIEAAQKYGADPVSFGKPYARFAAGAKGAGFSDAEINSATETLFKVKTALNMNPESLERTGKALSDMLAKGVVQAEELRGQLADHIPNAVGLAVRATGLSSDKLFEAMRKGQVDATAFVKLMLLEMDKEYSKTAEKAAKGPLAAVQRVKTQLSLASDEIGRAGLNDAVAKVAEDIVTTLKDPEAKENLQAIGRALGEIVLWLADAIKATARFVAENKAWLEPLGKALALAWGFKLAFGAAAAALLPFTSAIKGMHTLLSVGTTAAAGVFRKQIAAAALAASMAMTRFGTVVAGIIASMRVALGLAGAAGAIAATGYTAVQARNTHKNAEAAYELTQKEGGVAGASTEQLQANLQALQEKRDSLGAKIYRGVNWIRGRKSESDTQIDAATAQIQNELRLRELRSEDGRAKAATDAESARLAAQAEQRRIDRINAEQKALQGSLLKAPTDDGKGTGGGSDRKLDGTNALRAASIELENQRFANAEAEAQYSYAQSLISAQAYYGQLIKLREQQRDAKLRALEEESDKENKSDEYLQALQKRRQAIVEQSAKEITDLKREQFQEEKQRQEQLVGLQAELESKTLQGTAARMAAIDSKWKDLLAKMKVEGNAAGEAIVQGLIQREKFDVRMDEVRRQFEELRARQGVRSGELELQGASFQISGQTMQDQKLQLEKDFARERLAALQQELTMLEGIAGAEQRRLELQRQMLDERIKLNELTRTQKDFVDGITGAFEGALQKLGTKKGNSLKDLASSIVDDLNSHLRKSLSQSLADAFRTSLENAVAGGQGQVSGGGWKQQLANFVVGGVKNFMGGMGGLSAGGGGITLSSIGSSLVGAFTGGGLGRMSAVARPVGGSGFQAPANFIMNVSTPDANSFRASGTQLRHETNTGLVRAASRNG
jgi:tape measure domain-containing protein